MSEQDVDHLFDALASVQYNAWDDYLLQRPNQSTPFEKLTAHKKNIILNALALAA